MSSLELLLRASLAQLEGVDLDQPVRGISVVEAQRTLVKIRNAAARCDIEGALREERLLYLRVARACAAKHPDAQRIAAIAIQAAELPYDRGD